MEQELGAWDGMMNAGGIRQLKLIACTDVLEIRDPELYPDPAFDFPKTNINNALILKETAIRISILFGQDSASFAFNREDTPNGELYTVSIRFDVPRLQTSFLGWLEKNRQRRWIALVEDRNNVCYLFGDVDNGLSLMMAADSGVRAGRNKSSVTLTARSGHIPWLLNQLDFDTTEFSSEFSYEFNIYGA